MSVCNNINNDDNNDDNNNNDNNNISNNNVDNEIQIQQPQVAQHQNKRASASSQNSPVSGPQKPVSFGGGSSSSSNSGRTTSNMPAIPHEMASQLMLRSARGQRQYDVPQIGESLFQIAWCLQFYFYFSFSKEN